MHCVRHGGFDARPRVHHLLASIGYRLVTTDVERAATRMRVCVAVRKNAQRRTGCSRHRRTTKVEPRPGCESRDTSPPVAATIRNMLFSRAGTFAVARSAAAPLISTIVATSRSTALNGGPRYRDRHATVRKRPRLLAELRRCRREVDAMFEVHAVNLPVAPSTAAMFALRLQLFSERKFSSAGAGHRQTPASTRTSSASDTS